MSQLFTRQTNTDYLTKIIKIEEAEFGHVKKLKQGRPVELTPEEKRRKYNEYMKEYQKRRYAEDPKYREKRKQITTIRNNERILLNSLKPIKYHIINGDDTIKSTDNEGT